ncbi:hypothetical protein RJ639_003612 [Escallonia herrerae]|uniref:Phosphoinositide phospholipase C n=1 Tax=Escallonia herrerae TaxID=1293975 RepID=A0AA89AW10_9ASTE|nr:hypothetical protein RJ639_003612 [Escallonia herrerae]
MSSKQSYRICCFFRRRFKLAVAEAPAEIKALFDTYSENGAMAADHLQAFMMEVQGEDKVTKEDAEAVMEATLREHKHLKIFRRDGFDLEAFFRYLFSGVNSPLPSSPKVHQDMNAPLSQYFVYTGHNSYLTGNQLNSNSSDIPIIEALHKGVRVIELDMWPNSTKDDVDVVHGGYDLGCFSCMSCISYARYKSCFNVDIVHGGYGFRTLTTPVELIKCLRSIKEHAFVASKYPLVLTLEDHLTPDLQAKVAKMVTTTLGDALFSCGSECLAEFPSPESLKRKIIISTKPPKDYLESKSITEKDNGTHNVKDSSEEGAWGKEVSNLKDKFEAFDENAPDHGEFQDEEDFKDEDHNLRKNAPPEYKHLIAIQARKRKGGIKEWFHVDPSKVTRISLREQQLEKAVRTNGTDIIRFTQRNLLRIFPKGTRYDSSNYNPLIGWIHGAQMVAFNMQGMFRANGGCGYVKKPDFLLKADPVFDPNQILPVKKILKVKVYMGEGWYLDFHHTHFDVYSPPDFYAKVGIAGVPADSVMKNTKTIEDNWIPAWDEEFEYPLTVPELALLRIEVHEYDVTGKDDFGGQTCIPVSELRAGIRAVPLHDKKGEKYKSVKLLMRFEFV